MSSGSRPRDSKHTKSVTIEAKSIEQALVKAAGALGVDQDQVLYEVIKENTSKGFFSFFKAPLVVIKAWVKSPAKDFSQRSKASGSFSQKKKPVPSRAEKSCCDDHDDEDEFASGVKEPLSANQVEALTDELKDFCQGIVSRMVGETVQVDGRIDDERLILDVQDEFIAQQLNKNSKLAEALEHILRKKPRHLRQELPFRIFVDVHGVRRKREEDLVQMAIDLSQKVHENKRPIVLNYKSSYDRKIIHMALDKDERVYTKSIGAGPNRKLMILPLKDAQDGADRHLDFQS